MEEQSYAKHTKLVPGFHMVLALIILFCLAGSIFNLVHALGDHAGRRVAVLLTAMSFAMLLLFFYCRTFPLKAQDRAIRAEENLRHFALTGKLLDSRLSMGQVIGLRFASDGEFVALARRASEESLSPDAIKRAVKDWRVDRNRL